MYDQLGIERYDTGQCSRSKVLRLASGVIPLGGTSSSCACDDRDLTQIPAVSTRIEGLRDALQQSIQVLT